MFKNKQSHWLTLTGTQIHELCPCRGRQAECLYVCARPKTGLWVLLVWSVWCSQCAHRLRHQIDLFDPCSAVWFRTLKSLTVSSLMFSPFFHVEISCHLARNESDHGVPRFWLVSLKSPCGSPVPMQVKMLLERPKVSQVICVLQPYLDSEMLLSVTESNLIFKKKKSMPTHLTSSRLGIEYIKSFSESLLEPPMQLHSLLCFFSPTSNSCKELISAIHMASSW